MSLRRDWNEFWFAQRPATSLGLFRITFGLIVLSWCILIAPDLKTWYGEDGLLPLSAMRLWGANPIGLDVLAHVASFPATVALFALLMVSALFVSAGYRTRSASIVMYVLLVSFHHRDMPILNGGDTLQRNMAFLLMFADSGAACSVDRIIRVARGREAASALPMVEAWPQRLMQLQLAAVYLSTFSSKIVGPEWRDGTALYYALHLADLQRFSLGPLPDQLWFINLITYGTVFAEFCLGALIFVPRLRPYVLLLGLGLHLGIEYAMTVPLFSFTMIACYLNFVPQGWVESFARWLARQVKSPFVEIPASLVLPERTGDVIATLDVLHLVKRTPDALADAFSPTVTIRRLLWRLPLAWAAVFLPMALITVIQPTGRLLAVFGLLWPMGGAYVVRRVADGIAARATLGAEQQIPGDEGLLTAESEDRVVARV